MFDEKNNSLMNAFFFSEAEQEKIISRIWELLEKQAEKYNGCDSTSMTIERDQSLLESLLYTIGVTMEYGAVKEEILNGNLSLLIERGQNILKEKQKTVKVEWKLLCQELPRIRNVYYLSTIRELGTFCERYDVYYEAHNIPCSIDYWPLCPIPERIKGISYIETYIHCLQIENDFLNYFERNDIIGLYKKYVPGYEESLFNLCEPVLTNAIGLGLIGENVHPLNVSAAQREAIYDVLIDKSANEMQGMMEQAVLSVCRQIGMTEKNERNYFTSAISGLSARVYEAFKNQDLSHIFITFVKSDCC